MRSRLAGALADLRTAASSRAVWAGFVGSLLMLLGSLSPAYLPQASPVWDVLRGLGIDGPTTRVIGTVATLLGLTVLLESWFRLRPSRRRAAGRRQLRHWAVLAIVALPLVFGPPIFSHDAYSYAAHGWLIHNNFDPYQVGPGTLPGYYADQVAWVWRETTAPYGPLSLWLSHGIVILARFDPFLSAVLMRVPALIGVGLIGVLVPRIARKVGVDPAAASWFAVLNPILVIDFIGGAHNDSQMVGLMLLGIWLAMRYGAWWLGALVVGVAASIKQPAFLAAVALPFLVTPWVSWRPLPTLVAAAKATASLAIAVGVFAGISVVSGLGFGWVNAIEVPGMVDTVSPFTVLGHIVQFPLNLLGLDPGGRTAITVSRTIGWIAAGVGIVYFAVRHLGRRPLHFVSYSFLWFAFCAPAIHSWYLLWGSVLLPMTRPSTRALRWAIVGTVILLGYNAMNFGIRNGWWLLVFILFGATYWVVHTHELSQPMDEALDEIPEPQATA
ncbi:polyprenol phosphomannose-dependent alpha 1,6 mannosyltransferase MptB [Tessaracoccus defluvii]|uniref:Polyprenol phosphomannose-dependent alpha 1,6 mannosyltransferase MptB n=1 Tax=Tessaracoccus defluvii TaxID=1285901 RepID=A0A7H0H6M8_9ACTN|nr:polyprenol phosphomannose-dependent alpha 1,6 mannosyltransferase MptB [Tessaracoccus defluvii]QNP56194.1 polyprenol phosphomannose-dependent alpha 1,6 mannosyltransferase MptB [Tessaracoccus defluvii]